MGDWSRQGGGQRFDNSGFSGASNYGTNLTGNAAITTKGTWVELSAATPFTCMGIIIQMTGPGAAASFLLDIGVGASSSETVIAANLNAAWPRATQGSTTIYLPLSIPKGSRLSGRVQSNPGSQVLAVNLILVAGDGDVALGLAETIGPDLTTGLGKTVDPGGVVNTKGAWAEMSSGIGFRYRSLVIMPNIGGNTAASSCSWRIDIGIGAGGSETVLVPDLVMQANVTSDDTGQKVIGPLPVDIPAGTRVAVRCQCTTADAADRLLRVALIGVA